MANPGGACPVFANRVGISTSQLYAWNPILGSSGENCASQFWGNEYYCVAVSPNYVAPAQTTTSKTATPTGAAPAPGPTQSGIISTCSKYLMANAGGSCPVFANRAGISTAQLYAWNTVLGKNGENCATSFWANTYYCVGVRSSRVRRNAAAEVTGSHLPSAYKSLPEPSSIDSTFVVATSPTVKPSTTAPTTVLTGSHTSSTLSISSSAFRPMHYPVSAGTGYGSSNATTSATGTAASNPASTSMAVPPYTGSSSRTTINFGLGAVLVGLGFLWL